VVGLERVRARPVGAVLFVDPAIGVSRTLPLDHYYQGPAYRRRPRGAAIR